MLAQSHSQIFFPPALHPAINPSPSYDLQNPFDQRPLPLEVQQFQLQQRIQMEIQQRQQQQQQGFMHSGPFFEEQLLLARAQFELEAQAARAQAQVQAQAQAQLEAQAQTQALVSPFVHPRQLSYPNPLSNGMHDNSVRPLMQPSLSVDAMQMSPMYQPEMALQAFTAVNEPQPALVPGADEQLGLDFPMENFYRSTNVTARQRTQQACEKCRDRKTKVRKALQ